MQTINKQSGSRNQVTGTSKQAVPHNLQQQSTRLPTAVSGSLTKGLTLLDEFKNGFPSEGLSVASNRWWGSDSGDETETKEDGEQKADDAAAEMKPEEEKGSSGVDLTGTSLLTAVRKRAAEEGRAALKLGVFKSRRVHDIGDQERNLLLGLFHSSLPKEWTDNPI
ncbi:uncharacterized protein LOC116202428 [Punica granatum]|uniref:Uncharacterized protein LOC116202428 n=1 Tax=Punica granatum TaxID=22663 RepID=A0A6P8CYG2_PUNGR|nr:uncharacterized protein LOC116202428 [Punica granatum]